LHGCETWSLILGEEHKLRVFQNRVMRRIFVGKRDAVTGEWKTLHNEKLLPLPKYYSGGNIKQMSWARHIATMRTVDVLTGFWCEET